MNARTALDAARPVLARMDVSRGPDNTKADLIEVWSAVEAALRSLVGDASVGGQALIREARSRQQLSFDQANALVALQTVRERLDGPGYQPTDTDVNAARSAFLKLDAGLMGAPTSASSGSGAPSPYSPEGRGQMPAPPPSSAPIVPPAPGMQPMMKSARPRWVLPTILAVIAILILGTAGWWLAHRGSSPHMTQGVAAFQRGDRVTASSEFEQATRANPDDPMPHVYLARMAREVGNFTVANQELQSALKADPRNLQARREYGALFLSQGNYDMARTWYIHALEIDPNDQTSQGWLGCAMVKLNRADEGLRWLSRAGNGPWSVCRGAATPAPGVTPP